MSLSFTICKQGLIRVINGYSYKIECYYYDKNTLVDIVAIRDQNGEIVAKYEYDAWGNIISVTDGDGGRNTSETFIGHVNPFRYRGYYYDTETGFYYLQTRYYDPEICRFINADDYELISTLSEVPGQLNLYAYCGNNPIMFTDETGESIVATLLIGLVVAVIAAIDGGVSAELSGGDFWIGFGVGFVGGAIGYAIGFVSPYAGRIVSSLIYDVANPLLQKGTLEKDDVLNLILDLSMDMALSGLYTDFLSYDPMETFTNKVWKSGLNSALDGFVDVIQTQYIYNNVANILQKQKNSKQKTGNFRNVV